MGWQKKWFIRPLLYIGVGAVLLVLLDLLSNSISISGLAAFMLFVILYVLSAVLGGKVDEAARPITRWVQAMLQNWLYIYKISARFVTPYDPSMREVERILRQQQGWEDRFSVDLYGKNYLQLKFNQPDVVLLISSHPDYTLDEEDEDTERYTIEVRPNHTITYMFRRKKTAGDLRHVFQLVAEVSSKLTQELQGDSSTLIVNINRYTAGNKTVSRGPRPTNPPYKQHGLTVYRDSQAMQLIAESPGDITNHMFDNLTDLEPVQIA